jgi:hypothetical protein
MMQILTFQEAITKSKEYKKNNLLLGNGFSIACVPNIFTYSSLFGQADFSKMPQVKSVFERLLTNDFEEVVCALEHCSIVLPSYHPSMKKSASKIHQHAQNLKEILIKTIAKNHPERPSDISEEKYKACVTFLNNFLKDDGAIYSLNYDLLLYWTLMFGLNEKIVIETPNDGFGKDVEFYNGEINVSDYVTWQGESNAHGQNVHYLHGALHLFEKEEAVEKFTWINTGKPLIDQTREALASNRFPLFVAEGESKKKLTRITHSGYLYHSYKSFSRRMETGGKKSTACVFAHGVSFSESDSHIAKKISSGRVNHLFVSIYGDPKSEANKQIIKSAEGIKRKRKDQDLKIDYYDAKSAMVWG